MRIPSLRWLTVLLLLLGANAFAQRGGRSGGGAPRQAPALSPDEKARAETAAEWKDLIEHARANLPQHPPDPKIKFPSKNATFLGALRYAEDQRGDLEKYLNKLWSASADPVAQRTALAGLWLEAEKPVFVRGAVEEFFRKRSGGLALRPPDEPAASPAPVVKTPEPQGQVRPAGG